ncbi:7-carboxy-7-deazaguanine synthase QueE [Bacteroidota bacterium]
MNTKEKILLDEGKLLPLVEEFYTLQGEGFHTGKAAYFIRLGGCDVGCEWCDTKFSWISDLHKLTKTDDIIINASKYKSKAVVVTGGEPTHYNLNYLCDKLKNNGFETFIETSGAYNLTGKWDWICLSPKKTLPPINSIFSKANELKVIVQSKADFKWAEENAKKVKNNCLLYLQPEWSRYDTIINDIAEYIKDNPKWRISLQSHKFMHIP